MTDTVKTAPGAAARARNVGKRREQKKEANREAIVAAAREVFSELGYGATTVRDIIRRTGLASGTFYNYFKSKEEVFEALMDESAIRIRARIRAERIRARSFEEFVRAALATYFDYLATNREMHQLIRRNAGAIRMQIDSPEQIAGFEEIKEYLEEDIRDGVLPQVDTEYLTAAAIGLATEIGDRMLLREEFDTKEAANFASELLLGGFAGLPRAGD